MRNGGFHLSRTLLVPKSQPDVLLVQRGSDGNIDTAAAQIDTARSQIRIFKISEIQNAAVDYTKGEVLAWGLRNTVGFGEDPRGGIVSLACRLLLLPAYILCRDEANVLTRDMSSGPSIMVLMICSAKAKTSTTPTPVKN